jgi:hypothetical protein
MLVVNVKRNCNNSQIVIPAFVSNFFDEEHYRKVFPVDIADFEWLCEASPDRVVPIDEHKRQSFFAIFAGFKGWVLVSRVTLAKVENKG